MKRYKNNKNRRVGSISIILIILFAIFAIYYFYKASPSPDKSTNITVPLEVPSPSDDSTENGH